MPDEITTGRSSTLQESNLRAAYEFARETRDHGDALLWEVAAIVWGGQTLLLGFVLEAISGELQAQILILFIGVVGIVMAIFNHKIMRTRSDVCLGMIEVMSDLENRLEMQIKPQQILSAK